MAARRGTRVHLGVVPRTLKPSTFCDPVSGGFVDSLAKPGGNITGFTVFDYEMGAKWVELLKEIAPYVTHVGVIRDPTLTASLGALGAIQSAHGRSDWR